MSFLELGLELSRCPDLSSTLCVHFTFSPLSSWSFLATASSICDCGVFTLLASSLCSFSASPPYCSLSDLICISSAVSSNSNSVGVSVGTSLSSLHSFLSFRIHLINQIKASFLKKAKVYQIASPSYICTLNPKSICKKNTKA